MIVFRNLQLSESLNDFLWCYVIWSHVGYRRTRIVYWPLPDSIRLFSFSPKVIDHLRSEECGRHDVDNASSPNEICTRRILLKKSKVGANDGNTRLGCAPQSNCTRDGWITSRVHLFATKKIIEPVREPRAESEAADWVI